MKVFLVLLMSLFLISCTKLAPNEKTASGNIRKGSASKRIDYGKINVNNFLRIKKGMSADEVTKIMGTPMLIAKEFDRSRGIKKSTYIWNTKDTNSTFQVQIQNGKVKKMFKNIVN